jgi:hypothetical protein
MSVRRQLRDLIDLPLREQVEAALDLIPKVRPGELESLREDVAALALEPAAKPMPLGDEVADLKRDLARLMSDIQAATSSIVAARGDVESARAAARDARQQAEKAEKAASDVQQRLDALREN